MGVAVIAAIGGVHLDMKMSANFRDDNNWQRDAEMNAFHGEPTFEDLMSDPIVKAIMKADGVDESHLRQILPESLRMKPASTDATPRCSAQGWAA